jgi:hypothetical protein
VSDTCFGVWPSRFYSNLARDSRLSPSPKGLGGVCSGCPCQPRTYLTYWLIYSCTRL